MFPEQTGFGIRRISERPNRARAEREEMKKAMMNGLVALVVVAIIGGITLSVIKAKESVTAEQQKALRNISYLAGVMVEFAKADGHDLNTDGAEFAAGRKAGTSLVSKLEKSGTEKGKFIKELQGFGLEELLAARQQ